MAQHSVGKDNWHALVRLFNNINTSYPRLLILGSLEYMKMVEMVDVATRSQEKMAGSFVPYSVNKGVT